MSSEREPSYLFRGLMSVFAGHIIFACLMYLLAMWLGKVSPDPYAPLIAVVAVGFIGITQLVYVIPLLLWLKRKRKFVTMKGAIIGAVFTALLNGSCYFLFVVMA